MLLTDLYNPITNLNTGTQTTTRSGVTDNIIAGTNTQNSQNVPLLSTSGTTGSTTPTTTVPPVLSTEAGATKLNELNNTFTKIEPLPERSFSTGDTSPEAIAWRTEQAKLYGGTSDTTDTKTAKFVNENGQIISFTEQDLQNPDNIQRLKDGGYAFSEGEFVPNMDLTSTKQTQAQKAQADLENIRNEFLSYNVDTDPAFLNARKNIEQKFGLILNQMKKTNASREASLNTMGLRGGTTQYAGAVQMGIMGEELSQANARITEIISEEQSAIASARNAYESGKFDQFSKKMAVLEKTRDEKNKAYEDYNKKLTDFVEKQKETEFQYKMDTNVGDLLDQGFTTPAEISKELGKLGIKATSKQIKDSLSNLTNDDVVKNNVKAVSDWAKTAFDGGETEIASKIQALNPMSKTFAQDLSRIQAQMKNPMAKLDLAIKQVELAKKTAELKAVGELTAKEKKDIAAGLAEAETSIPIMQNKINQANEVLSSSGLNSRVGTTGLTRSGTGRVGTALAGAATGAAAGSFLGPVGTAVGGVGGAILGSLLIGSPDEATGAAQNFSATVHNLTSGLTLQTLIDAKARGATFGALSNEELRLLAASATKINDAEIYINKDGKVVPKGIEGAVASGRWNMSEADFKREVKFIQSETARALKLAGQKVLADDESTILDAAFSQPTEDLSGESYFNE